MSLQIGLRDLGDVSVPIPINYIDKLECSEDNLQEKIEEVASTVSKLYARFPRLSDDERKQLSEKGARFIVRKEIPSASECEQFEAALKAKIMTKFSKGCCSCFLSTEDHGSVRTLYKIALSAFQKDESELNSFFPLKTKTVIFLSEEKKLFLQMNFRWIEPVPEVPVFGSAAKRTQKPEKFNVFTN